MAKAKLLLKLLSSEKLAASLVYDSQRWAEVYSIALKSGLGGILYKKIAGAGLTESECPILPDLKKVYDKYMFHNLKILHQYEKLRQQLSEAGIPFIPLKGIALINDYYKNPGLRYTSDIDLLFRREDSERYLGLFGLKAERFQPSRFFSKYISNRSDAKLVTEFSVEGVRVDLHEQLQAPGHPFRIESIGLWEDAYRSNGGGVVYRMSAEHLLVYLATHLYRHLARHLKEKVPFRFVWFYDIAMVLQKEKDRLDEAKLLDLARSANCHEVVCCMLTAAADVFRIEGLTKLREEALGYGVGKTEAVYALYFTLDPVKAGVRPNPDVPFWNKKQEATSVSGRLIDTLSYLFPSRAYLRSKYPGTRPGFIYTKYPQWLIKKTAGRVKHLIK